MAVVFVVFATLVIAAAVFGYVIYLTDGFDSKLHDSDGQLRKQSGSG